eukprot:SAG31_NODE_2273_length_6037_cov_11.461862_7_plen_142_part_00
MPAVGLPARANTSELERFREIYEEWQTRRLNDLSDLHVCPICYTWLAASDGVSSSSGPMEVLCSSDHGEEGAGQVCFRLRKAVQQHLRHFHGIDLASMEIDGELYKRFKVLYAALPRQSAGVLALVTLVSKYQSSTSITTA